jgi:hypothetical protein
MKYAGTYYSGLKLFSKAQSNLNQLCWNIEKWEKQFKFKNNTKNSGQTSDLLIDESVEWNEYRFEQIKQLYREFNQEMAEAKKQQAMSKLDYDGFFSDLTKAEIINTDINWGAIYEKYIIKAQRIISNPKELANYGVEICYFLYPKRSNLFVWIICEEGMFLNLERNREQNLQLPQRTEDQKETEYLGRYYKLINLFD